MTSLLRASADADGGKARSGSPASLSALRAPACHAPCAPPPASAAAATAALQLLPTLDERRTRVLSLAGRLRDGLTARGWRTGGDTPIVPVHTGDEAAAVTLANRLREAGFWVTPIRYPTVPRGGARLRLTVTAHHLPEHIDRFLAALGHA